MRFNKATAFIAAFITTAACLNSSISSSADLTDVADSAWISGDCAVVYPYTNAQTGTIMKGSAEYLTVSDENGTPLCGDIAQVTFSLDNVSTGFQVIDITLGFDSEKFTYLGHDEDTLYDGVLKKATLKTVTIASKVYEMEEPVVKLVTSSLNQITDTGTLLKLNFFVPQGTKAGLYPIDVSINDYGHKQTGSETDLPCVVVNNGFISVPGCAENTDSIDFGENSEILDNYIEANLIDTALDDTQGCSPFDIFWSLRKNGSDNDIIIGDMASLELGLRGDANLDGIVDAKDAALIAKYQSTLSATGAAIVMNEANNNLALTLANVNGDTASDGENASGCIDAKDASNVAKYTSMYATYPADADEYKTYTAIWTELGFFGS